MKILEKLLYELIMSEYNRFIYKELYIRTGEYRIKFGYGIYQPNWDDHNLVKNNQYHVLNKELTNGISDSWFRFFLNKCNVKISITEFKELLNRNL